MALGLPAQVPNLVLIDAAASLLTEPEDENPEYDRALTELVTRAFGLTSDEQPQIAALIEGRRNDPNNPHN